LELGEWRIEGERKRSKDLADFARKLGGKKSLKARTQRLECEGKRCKGGAVAFKGQPRRIDFTEKP
jgi:hypothetical protein